MAQRGGKCRIASSANHIVIVLQDKYDKQRGLFLLTRLIEQRSLTIAIEACADMGLLLNLRQFLVIQTTGR